MTAHKVVAAAVGVETLTEVWASRRWAGTRPANPRPHGSRPAGTPRPVRDG